MSVNNGSNIEIVGGNIFDATVQVLVNPVNIVGVMGAGLAVQFKRLFPDNYIAYAQAARERKLSLGKMFVFARRSDQWPQYIVNFPTKQHWRSPSQLTHIITGLKDLKHVITKLAIASIAIPALGCGLGGLDWPTVCTLAIASLDDLPQVHILLYEPAD